MGKGNAWTNYGNKVGLTMSTIATKSHYTGEAGRKYASRFGSDPTSDILGKCFLERIGSWISTTDRVFEFGCGGGRNMLAIKCAEAAGYDLNEHSRALASGAGLRVFDRVEDIPKGHWSVVVCSHVLEHVPSPLDTLELLKSLLTPRGKLILTVPVQGHLLKLTPLEKENDHHIFCWNPDTMRNLLLVAGFDPKYVVVRTAARENLLAPMARISWWVFRMGAWTAGVVLRRREMTVVSEAA